jgi:predicted regulator of Ras-like GTPase activity (Roadblock/LC7/MglB family)
MVAEKLDRADARFEGEIAGLGLADVIQLDVVNQFSGCIDVQYEDLRGLVFLKDGEVVHAEQGPLVGEEAFYEILSWPGGHFSHKQNVATTRSTISKSCHFLILEAYRLMDERRAARSSPQPPAPAAPPPAPAAQSPAPAAPPPAPAAPAQAGSAAAILQELRAIPGVAYAVIQGKDGGRVADDSYEGEVLSGQALYVAMVGRQLGDQLQAGEIHSAVVHGAARHVVLFAAKSHLVTAVVDAAAQVGAVEAAVRKVLLQGRAR